MRALVELRDRGKFLVFLARRRSVQIIGPAAEFIQELSVGSDGTKLEPKDSREVLEEIRRHLALRVDAGNAKRVVDIFVQSVYADEFRKLDDKSKQQFREQLERKTAIIEQQLHSPELQTRDERFGSTTAACLEDLEFELVEERTTGAQDEPVRDPFLRLRIRYSEGTEQSPRGFGLRGFLSVFPFGGKEHSFELECDESDIDLLMVRLAAAKQRLLTARENNTEPGNV